MLRTQGDIISEFLVRMNQTSTVGFYTDAILTTWASNANSWAAAKYKWPFTEGRYSTTFASLGSNEDGYTTLEYPEGFRTDSIRLLTVGGKKFFKKNFYKFRDFLEGNPNDTSKLFSDFSRVVYINPRASDLSGTVTAWGQINIPALASDSNIQVPTATTIFTDVENDGNEALVEKMMSYAYQREKSPTGVVKGKLVSSSGQHAQTAEMILDAIWKRVGDEQFGYQDTQSEGMYKRFDVLRGGFKEDVFRRDQWGF